MEKRRTVAQDAAKGMMIIAVVFFHCYLMSFENPAAALSEFSVLNAFFPFILSSFFFYTGYNYVPKDRTFKEQIARRAKQLLIPLVFAAFTSIVIMSSMELIYDHANVGATFHAIGNSILYSLMSEPMAWMIGFPKDGSVVFSLVLSLGLLWFLYCLFICSVFFYLLVKHTNKKVSTLISVVVGLLAISFVLGQFVGTYLPYTVQCYPVVLAIMLMGAYLRQSRFLTKRISTKKGIIFHTINAIIAEGIVVGICFLAYYRSGATITGSLPGGKFDDQLKGLDAIIAFIFGIFGTYFIHTFARLVKKIPFLGAGLQWVGNHSAFFYLFHPIFLTFASIVFFKKQVIWGKDYGFAQAYIYVAFTIACLVVTCLIIDYIIKRRHIIIKMREEMENNKDPEDE